MDFIPQVLAKSFKNTRKIVLHDFCLYVVVQMMLPMKELRTLETEELIDMLTKLTGQYTDKMAISNGMQLSQSEYEIALI
ncbi:MAG: hypothetical protein ABIO79_16680, partial [Ferruginibacter sp.]